MYKKNPLCAFCRREFGLPLAASNQDLIALAKLFKRKQSGEPDEVPMETSYDQEVGCVQLSMFGNLILFKSMWFWLPDEVVIDIFGHLQPADLGRTGLVCHHFRNISDDSFLWRSLCKEHFPFVQIASYGNDWKKCFIMRRNMQTGWETGRPGDFKVTDPLRMSWKLTLIFLDQVQVLRGHSNYISCFDYYRNNVVSGSADSTLSIW